MGLPLKHVETEALSLPSPDRAELAARLIASLEEDEYDDPAEVERAWADEIGRRVAELDSGTAELSPAEDVFAELRARPRR